MLPQPITDALIVLGMFVVRIGLPVFILIVLAGWLQQKLQPRETEEIHRRTDRAHIIPFSRSAAQSPSAQMPEKSEQHAEPGDKAAPV